MIKFYSSIKAIDHLEYSDMTMSKLRAWFQNKYGFFGYPVHTCTTALEVAAIALDLKAGDEVIMPSYTFVSTANAFALRGCKIVFVDVDDSMNMAIEAVEEAITSKTKVIVPVHYGGQSCNMTQLMILAREHDLYVVEDAAQSLDCKFNEKYLGRYGHIACMSFHQTKNIQCGEGGYLIINDDTLKERIEGILYYGTNRKAFDRKEVPCYTWQSIGTSALLDGYRSMILLNNLNRVDKVSDQRRQLLHLYREELKNFEIFESNGQQENGHIFFIKTKNIAERQKLQIYLKEHGVIALSHYEPLHKATFGNQFKYYEHKGCTDDASRLLRLPIHEDMTDLHVKSVCQMIKRFYE